MQIHSFQTEFGFVCMCLCECTKYGHSTILKLNKRVVFLCLKQEMKYANGKKVVFIFIIRV